MAYRDSLAALADPTRREIFEQLRDGPRAVGELARQLPVSRPAVSQHLKVLKEAGLVADRAEGTRRVYQIDPHGLALLRRWLDGFWDDALAAFEAEAAAVKVRSTRETEEKGAHAAHDKRRTRAKNDSGTARNRRRV